MLRGDYESHLFDTGFDIRQYHEDSKRPIGPTCGVLRSAPIEPVPCHGEVVRAAARKFRGQSNML